MVGVGFSSDTNYDGGNIFCINELCDVIFTQRGKFSFTCLFELHVNDMIVYERAVICSVCQNIS